MTNYRSLYQGVYPALITPLKEADKVDYDTLEKLIEIHISQGMRGFYICGTTAEAEFLSVQQRIEIMTAAADYVGSRANLIAQIGYASIDDSIKMGQTAKELGYQAISLITPADLQASRLADYYNQISQAVDLPLFIYVYPQKTGLDLKLSDYAQIFSNPKIIGIKYTSLDPYRLERIRRMRGDKLVIFNGHDEVFTAALAVGADGAIGSTYNFQSLSVDLFNYFKNGDLQSAGRIQSRLNDVIETMIKICGPNITPGVKFAVEYVHGLSVGECLNPKAKPISQADQDTLKQALDNLIKSGNR